jgi:hypothetical protein
MEQQLILIKEKVAPLLCQRCGHRLRLIGSESHPFEGGTELLTYCCTGCDDLSVVPTPIIL